MSFGCFITASPSPYSSEEADTEKISTSVISMSSFRLILEIINLNN